MSTSVDGGPPSATPEPADRPDSGGPSTTDTGPAWLRDEMARLMAVRRSGGGGRHARRDTRADLPDGAGYVPRHSVAPLPPAPAPAAPGPARRSPPTAAWSGPQPRADEPRADEPRAARPRPAPEAPGVDGPPASPAPGAAGPVGDEPEVLGGPSLSRPFPRAFRPGARPAPEGPAVFGGPGFDVPPARPAPGAPVRPADGRPAREPAAEFGGPGFDRSIARADLDDGPAHPGPRPDHGPDLRPQAGPVEVTPPRAPARLLAPPGHVVEALGHRPAPADRVLPDATGPLFTTGPAAFRPGPDGRHDDGPHDDDLHDDDLHDDDLHDDDLHDDDLHDDEDYLHEGHDGEESTILWSADAPAPATADAPDPDPATDAVAVALPNRVKVVFSVRRNAAPPVRTVVDVQEGGAVGELLRANLIGSQLAVAVRFAIGVTLTLGLLPLAFALFPEIGRTEFLGLRLPWLLLGVLVYPFLLGLGWWHTRTAERVEQNFADHVQD